VNLPDLQPSALAGLKVVEMGQLIAGTFAGKTLGEFGADVIKIEAPGAGGTAKQLAPAAGRQLGVVAGAAAQLDALARPLAA
jgi:crotonobetainyl-CoA:carnitine CoA-transferase CaiB-like acyl-CoA transferase